MINLAESRKVAMSTFVICLLAASYNVEGAEYYVDANAPDDTGNGSVNSPRKYIQSGMRLLSSNGGDTLTLEDGTYNDSRDQLTPDSFPSNPSDWTTIRARNIGMVIVDTSVFKLNYDTFATDWMHIDGIRFTRPGSYTLGGLNVKVTNSFFAGSLRMGTIFQRQFDVLCQNVLIEDVWILGIEKRYPIATQSCINVVWRRVVVKHAGGYINPPGKSNPSANFMVYSSEHVRLQNTISIDSPVTNNDKWKGAYYTADHINTWGRYFQDVRWQGALAINIVGGWGFNLDNTHDFNGFESAYDNCLVINTDQGGMNSNGNTNNDVISYNQCTVIGTGGDGVRSAARGDYYKTVSNSIFLQNAGSAIGVNIDSTSNNYAFLNGNNNPGDAGVVDDPRTNGLLYPVRVESGSRLATAGQGGTHVGADLSFRWGRTGSMWGEVNFDVETTEPLWPYPNEQLVKEDLCRGQPADGFCAGGTGLYGGAVTLTSYIWEALGNACPAEICSGTGQVRSNPPENLSGTP